MVYDAIEQAATSLSANFDADLAALATAKGEAGITQTATVYKRRPATVLFALAAVTGSGVTLPAIGVWVQRTATQARRQDVRDNVHQLVFDYVARSAGVTAGSDVTLEKQAELAAEALLRTVDRLVTAGGGYFGAGELAGSVVIELSGLAMGPGQSYYEEHVRLTCPVTERDTGLA